MNQKKIRIDKRFKVRKFFRITPTLKIQFSDNYNEELGFICLTKKIKKHLKQL